MIIDGRAIAADILASAKQSLPKGAVPVVRALVVQASPATQSYLKIKSARAQDAGMTLEIMNLPATSTTEEVISALATPGADAIIVQLPLPDSIDTIAVLEAIPTEKDADVLSASARDLFNRGEHDALLPPVTDAVREVLLRTGIDPKGKRVAVVGNGWLVGEPTSVWFMNNGAEVTTLTRESKDLSVLKEAEIIVSGAGSPGLIQPEHLSKGVTLIDAGTSESGGQLVGDADPACAEVAGMFTPVPGGVGPIAVACLFRNAALLINREHLQQAQKDV